MLAAVFLIERTAWESYVGGLPPSLDPDASRSAPLSIKAFGEMLSFIFLYSQELKSWPVSRKQSKSVNIP